MITEKTIQFFLSLDPEENADEDLVKGGSVIDEDEDEDEDEDTDDSDEDLPNLEDEE